MRQVSPGALIRRGDRERRSPRDGEKFVSEHGPELIASSSILLEYQDAAE
jgi:hypothetical protein